MNNTHGFTKSILSQIGIAENKLDEVKVNVLISDGNIKDFEIVDIDPSSEIVRYKMIYDTKSMQEYAIDEIRDDFTFLESGYTKVIIDKVVISGNFSYEIHEDSVDFSPSTFVDASISSIALDPPQSKKLDLTLFKKLIEEEISGMFAYETDEMITISITF